MRAPIQRTTVSATIALLLAVLVMVSSGQSEPRQAVGTAAARERGAALEPKYFGAKACMRCHRQPEMQSPLLCRCTEVPIWEKQDKHRLAYTNAFGPGAPGHRIVAILGYKPGEVQTRCVVCHGVNIDSKKHRQLLDESFDLSQSEGVSCVVCHGAFANWIDVHGPTLQSSRARWRALSRSAKQEQFGMTDLWDPLKRARLCASCHIGNAAEGKVVTHEMYAAGHPPLPAYEIAYFSDEMPRHWQYVREKSPEARKVLGFEANDLELSRLVLVGGLAALGEAMNLLASESAKADESQTLIDFAQLDCYACHHDLKRPSWRQERGYAGRAGRPQFRPWSLVLARAAVNLNGEGADAFASKLAALQAAFDVQPFGRPGEVAKAARELSQWTARLAARLSDKSFVIDRRLAIRVAGELQRLGTASDKPLDYDSARQLVWAFRAIWLDLKEGSAQPAGGREFDVGWQALDRELNLSLPATQQRSLLAELPGQLERIGDYDPVRFRQLFSRLCELTPSVD